MVGEYMNDSMKREPERLVWAAMDDEKRRSKQWEKKQTSDV